MLFKQYNEKLLVEWGKNSFKRIQEYEGLAPELIQIMVQQHICNLIIKYRSSKEWKRRDARLSAMLVFCILSQFYDKKHPYNLQFQMCISEIFKFFQQFKKSKNETPGADKQNAESMFELDFYTELTSRMKNDKEEKFKLEISMTSCYQDLAIDFVKIDNMDVMLFVDGIDTESISYRYYNSLNQFRYDQSSNI